VFKVVKEPRVAINHSQHIGNTGRGYLLEERVVDQVLFIGRRQTPVALSFRISQDNISVVIVFQIVTHFPKSVAEFIGHLGSEFIGIGR